MKMPNFTATSLRMTLSISLFAITILMGVIFYFADSQLKKTATEVSHTVIDANASQNNVQTLQKIQRELEQNKDTIAQANSIVADSQSYQYQDQIVSDLNQYAGKAGISITNIDFSSTSQTGSGTTPDNKAQTTTPGATAAPTPAGVKTTSVAVTMKNPLGYNNFLQFLRSIEDNLTKMQVQKVSLSKGTGGDDDISSDVLTIQVYVR
jgi:TolA-binding protein